MSSSPAKATVANEGCTLHYWYMGSGPLLIMVPGGGGIGRRFDAILPYLAPYFTVVAYDRRQSGASKVAEPTQLNPAQQCRDIIAITQALGQTQCSLFGNSGGAILAFQFAVSYPQALQHVIAHEAPSTALLPDSTELLDWAFDMLETYRTQGSAAAGMKFFKQLKGDKILPRKSVPDAEDSENFWAREYLQFTIYCPDLRKIVENGVSIAVAAGRLSADAFYARTTVPQAEILGCERFLLPGNHNGYDYEPEAFAAALVDAYKRMEKAKPRF